MNPIYAALAFALTFAFVLLLALLVRGKSARVEQRLRELRDGVALPPEEDRVAEITQTTLSKIGQPLLPEEEDQRTRLKSRLVHAGFYSPHALVVFLGVKMLLMGAPIFFGVCLAMVGVLSLLHGVSYGVFASVLGMLAPSFWLDHWKARRQVTLRKGLPDAMDAIIICLEGGLSLPAAFDRLVRELRLAHPELAGEMRIVEREVQLGRSTGEALRHFGERCDLEEMRSLASVVIQAERFGAGLVKSLRIHAESLREQRLMHAEEKAQKAAVKIVFPTILFILPAVFLVLAGPAAIQIVALLRALKTQ